jgi:hypothetical protein
MSMRCNPSCSGGVSKDEEDGGNPGWGVLSSGLIGSVYFLSTHGPTNIAGHERYGTSQLHDSTSKSEDGEDEQSCTRKAAA